MHGHTYIKYSETLQAVPVQPLDWYQFRESNIQESHKNRRSKILKTGFLVLATCRRSSVVRTSSEVRFPIRTNVFFFLLWNVPACPLGAHPTSHSVGTGVLSGGKSGRGVKLTTHLHPVPRLRTRGVIRLLLPNMPSLCGQGKLRYWPLATYGRR